MSDPSPSTIPATINEGVPPNLKERVRSGIPDAAVGAVVALRTRRQLRSPALDVARKEMTWLLDAVKSPAEIEETARRFVARDALRAEMRWHPRLLDRATVEGVEHLAAARKLGRGVVISFLHHGQYEGAMSSVAKADAPIDIAISPEMIGPEAPAFLRQHVRVGIRFGNTGVNAGAGAGLLVERLTSGRVLAIATDVPGRTPLEFLGKQRFGSSGAARLAYGTNSPVVLMTSHGDDSGAFGIRLAPAIEPRDFASHDELLVHLMHAHEPAILAWPEAYHFPTMRWGGSPGE